MNNVLIPTDFTNGSLQPIARLAEAFPEKTFTVFLFHPFYMPDGISELLLLHKSIPLGKLFSDGLRAECRKLKQQYGNSIRSIIFKPVYGNNPKVLNALLEANEIDTILYDGFYPYSKAHRYSIDIKNCFKKASIPVLKTEMLKKPKPVQETVYKELVV